MSILKKLKTFRKDRVLEMLSGIEGAEDRLEYHLGNISPVKDIQSRLFNKSGNPEVCFTGFRKGEKEKLASLAKKSEVFIRSSVTKSLDFLCCGCSAGPTKIENARPQGVVILTEYQFIELLETGEVPEQQESSFSH